MTKCRSKQQGFTLFEVLISLLLSSIILLGVEKLLPQLIMQVRGIEQRQHLRQEIQRLLRVLEKAIRRAGYCFGERCLGPGLTISEQGRCLLLRWDDNHNGVWEGPELSNSDYFGFRHRMGAIETKRGATDCYSQQWLRLNEPERINITHFVAQSFGSRIEISLSAQAGNYSLSRKHIVNRENSQ